MNVEVLVILALVAIIIAQMIIQKQERKDLYNRIQSRSLSEYKGEPVQQGVSAHKQVLMRWRGRSDDR